MIVDMLSTITERKIEDHKTNKVPITSIGAHEPNIGFGHWWTWVVNNVEFVTTSTTTANSNFTIIFDFEPL